MQVISDLIQYIQTITVVVVILVVLFGLLGVYVLKVRKSKVVEKNIDYSRFERADTLEYVKFDDVGEQMLATDGSSRFIAAIRCVGLDYRDMEAEEKLQTIRGYLTFFNVVDNQRIQFHQSARDVNLDDMVTDYQERMSKLSEKQFLLNLDYEETKAESNKEDITLEEYDIYYEKLKGMQREIVSLGYQVEQLKAQIQYMEAISGDKADPYREELYVFDWSYHALEFSSSELDSAEIYAKAEKQLKMKANAYIAALRNAGVKAHMISGVELLEEIRRYTHPVSAAKYRVEDILESAYDSIAVTSDSLKELEKKVHKKALDEIAEELKPGKERRGA